MNSQDKQVLICSKLIILLRAGDHRETLLENNQGVDQSCSSRLEKLQ